MPDLGQLLASLGDSGAKIFKATVDAVGDGVLTIRANGGTFTRVPYLPSGFYPGSGPEIGNQVYVIAQENWGMLALGRPAVTQDEPIPDPGIYTLDAYTLARWNPGSWTVSTTGYTDIQPNGSAAVFFYDDPNAATNPAMQAIQERGLATASIHLAVPGFQQEVARDTTALTIRLHRNGAPNGVFDPLPDSFLWFDPWRGFDNFISLPLSWATMLINGQADGIFVTADEDLVTVGGPGTLRFTSL